MPALVTAKRLREERANLASRMQEILADAGDAGLSVEQREEFDRLHTRQEELRADAERIEASERLFTEMQGSRGTVAGQRDRTQEEREREERERTGASERPTAEQEAAAFESYIRYGMAALNPEERAVMNARFSVLNEAERRALAAGSDAAGGFTVPDGPMQRIVSAQQRFGGMRRARTTQFTTQGGNPLPIPTDNDTSNTGELLSENTAAGEQDISFGQGVLNAYMYSSKLVLVSIQLLQDTSVDLNPFVFDKLGMRLGRIQNTHFTVGDGAAKPQGVVTGATSGVTAASATAVTRDELVELIHSVDADYREMGAEFMFSDDTLKELKLLKDGDGRPLWQASVQVGEPDRIEGYTYVVNNDVADMAASAKSILFGDFSNYYIRDVGGVQVLRLTERYAEKLQVGFLAFRRGDGLLVDAGTNPIKYITMGA